MTLAEKVGQMTQAERAGARRTGRHRDLRPRLGALRRRLDADAEHARRAGPTWSTASRPRRWPTPLQIPMIYGVDAVHGHNNVLGATLFPHNIGLGATRDPALVEQEGAITAIETQATGVPWAFAPCLCVARDERWGRTYESFGEDPALVDQMETIIDGLQGDGAARTTACSPPPSTSRATAARPTARRRPARYTIDQGVTPSRRRSSTRSTCRRSPRPCKRGVGSVMPSYSSVQITGKDGAAMKMHANGDLITDWLKSSTGFDGFVITDWQAHRPDRPGDYKSDVKARRSTPAST